MIRRAVERQRYCALVGRGRRIVLTEMGGADPTLVGAGPERHRPKSRRSLPPSMPSTVTHEDFEHFYEGRRTGRGADPYFLRLRDGLLSRVMGPGRVPTLAPDDSQER